ncbi:hypothetical protein HF1_06130 [Mycoplasma haemofelis str. Langford 1]|uniref:Uncharacterized protein n=1 Tax=Mycoplasma haemofelis (strain Langford 1) TaxID=941640 RepID=E8ZHK0_MYCHL|nr:hypothetical protein [Mycoplasma haemofelis]CBY92621.1 hypothetical protein HF1_06130 [Mycoplasma haemofelis str. Langford 1]
MTSSLMKGGIAAAGAGGIGMGGWAISNYVKSTDNTVKAALISKGHKLTSSLPSSKQDASWAKVANTYKLEAKQELKIKEGEVTANDIRNWCEKHMEVQSSASILEKAAKWCVVYSSFKDKLDEEKLTLETDDGTLNTKYDSLGDLTSVVSAITPDAGTGNENGRKLKKWCETMIHSSYGDDSTYQTFKGHCTKAVAQR